MSQDSKQTRQKPRQVIKIFHVVDDPTEGLPFLMLYVAPGVQTIYKFEFEPKEDVFREFSEELYAIYEQKHGKPKEKMYVVDNRTPDCLPNEVFTATETEKMAMLAAAAHLEKMFKRLCPEENKCEPKIPFVKKLEMLTKFLPPVLFKGSRFAAPSEK